MAGEPEPYGAFRFVVEINGIDVQTGFTEVTGLATETAVIEYRTGRDRRTRKLPGQHRFQNIVLKRGLTSDNSLWAWRKQILDGVPDRRAGSIIVLDAADQEVLRYNFFEAWPVRWEGPTLNSSGNEVAIETVEIAVELLELAV